MMRNELTPNRDLRYRGRDRRRGEVIETDRNEMKGDAMTLKNDSTLTIAKVAPLLRQRKISPVELTEAFLRRISQFQPKLNAFLTVCADLARRQAREAEKEIQKGRYRGPLHGIPITLKDLFSTAGVRTTAGSKILRHFTPPENATVVQWLREAGAILLGKTNLHEFAYGVTNHNPHYGPVRNPWDRKRIPGGSSGGSAAAVSAGLCLASLGTDPGGSIRIPSACCAVVGLKPTYGRVPLRGVIPLSFSLDHAGPIGRSVEDVALVLNAISGFDPKDRGSIAAARTISLESLSKGVRGLRIGVPKQYFFYRLQGAVRERVREALRVLEDLGARIQEIQLDFMKETAFLAGEITVAEALAYHGEWFPQRAKDYGDDVRARLELGAKQLTQTYFQAQRGRILYTQAFSQALEDVSVLATPTLPALPPEIGQEEVKIGKGTELVRAALLRFTRPANLTGFPALSLPCGFSSEGLPVGLQLIGRPWDEKTLLRVAYAYERATPWHRKFPEDGAILKSSLLGEKTPSSSKGPGPTVLL